MAAWLRTALSYEATPIAPVQAMIAVTRGLRLLTLLGDPHGQVPSVLQWAWSLLHVSFRPAVGEAAIGRDTVAVSFKWQYVWWSQILRDYDIVMASLAGDTDVASTNGHRFWKALRPQATMASRLAVPTSPLDAYACARIAWAMRSDFSVASLPPAVPDASGAPGDETDALRPVPASVGIQFVLSSSMVTDIGAADLYYMFCLEQLQSMNAIDDSAEIRDAVRRLRRLAAMSEERTGLALVAVRKVSAAAVLCQHEATCQNLSPVTEWSLQLHEGRFAAGDVQLGVAVAQAVCVAGCACVTQLAPDEQSELKRFHSIAVGFGSSTLNKLRDVIHGVAFLHSLGLLIQALARCGYRHVSVRCMHHSLVFMGDARRSVSAVSASADYIRQRAMMRIKDYVLRRLRPQEYRRRCVLTDEYHSRVGWEYMEWLGATTTLEIECLVFHETYQRGTFVEGDESASWKGMTQLAWRERYELRRRSKGAGAATAVTLSKTMVAARDDVLRTRLAALETSERDARRATEEVWLEAWDNLRTTAEYAMHLEAVRRAEREKRRLAREALRLQLEREQQQRMEQEAARAAAIDALRRQDAELRRGRRQEHLSTVAELASDVAASKERTRWALLLQRVAVEADRAHGEVVLAEIEGRKTLLAANQQAQSSQHASAAITSRPLHRTRTLGEVVGESNVLPAVLESVEAATQIETRYRNVSVAAERVARFELLSMHHRLWTSIAPKSPRRFRAPAPTVSPLRPSDHRQSPLRATAVSPSSRLAESPAVTSSPSHSRHVPARRRRLSIPALAMTPQPMKARGRAAATGEDPAKAATPPPRSDEATRQSAAKSPPRSDEATQSAAPPVRARSGASPAKRRVSPPPPPATAKRPPLRLPPVYAAPRTKLAHAAIHHPAGGSAGGAPHEETASPSVPKVPQ